jgi:hypothetical protein
MESKYCKWFNIGIDLDDNKYIFYARCCGEQEKVKRYSKRWKELYSDNENVICPYCGRPITIGCEMD